MKNSLTFAKALQFAEMLGVEVDNHGGKRTGKGITYTLRFGDAFATVCMNPDSQVTHQKFLRVLRKAAKAKKDKLLATERAKATAQLTEATGGHRVSELEEELAAAYEEVTRLEEVQTRHSRQLSAQAERVQELEATLVTRGKEVATLRAKSQELAAGPAELRKELSEWREKAVKAERRVEALEDEVDAASDHGAELSARLAGIEDWADSAGAEITGATVLVKLPHGMGEPTIDLLAQG